MTIANPTLPAELTAGVELDKRVALALGVEPTTTWEIWNADETATAGSYLRREDAQGYYDDALRSVADSWMRDRHVGPRLCYPPYSRGLASAWEVVGQIQAKGFWWKIVSPFTADSPWSAGFTPQGVTGWNGRPDYEGHGATFELAVCEAVLAWAAEKEQDAAEALAE